MDGLLLSMVHELDDIWGYHENVLYPTSPGTSAAEQRKENTRAGAILSTTCWLIVDSRVPIPWVITTHYLILMEATCIIHVIWLTLDASWLLHP